MPNGYCTHEYKDDSDCCAVTGECRTGIKQVCSPFTNTSTPKYCFLSCEEEDIRARIAANADASGWDGVAAILDGAPADLETAASRRVGFDQLLEIGVVARFDTSAGPRSFGDVLFARRGLDVGSGASRQEKRRATAQPKRM